MYILHFILKKNKNAICELCIKITQIIAHIDNKQFHKCLQVSQVLLTYKFVIWLS